MLDQLTHARFAGYINQRFRLRLDRATLSLELITVEPFPVREEAGNEAILRQGFSLVFRGPKEPLLPQAIYTVEHEGALGALPIFLVPIESDAQGARYEAVFN